MPPFAICSSSKCLYSFDSKEEEPGPTRLGPQTCPLCGSKTIFYCPQCFFPILQKAVTGQVLCSNCRAPLRADDASGQSKDERQRTA